MLDQSVLVKNWTVRGTLPQFGVLSDFDSMGLAYNRQIDLQKNTWDEQVRKM